MTGGWTDATGAATVFMNRLRGRFLFGWESASKNSPTIVRLVLKTTVANVEIRKPSGKWDKVAGAAYGDVVADPDTGVPRGLGLVSTTGFAKLMQDNRDAAVFG